MNIYLHRKPKRINSFSVTVTLLSLTTGYLGWAFLPAWWPIFQMNGIMRAACNAAYRSIDDKEIMDGLLAESQRTGLGLTRDSFEFERIPFTDDEVIELREKGIANDRMIQRGSTCVLRLYHEGEIEWPLVGTTTDITWEREVRGSLENVDWAKEHQDCTCVSLRRTEAD